MLALLLCLLSSCGCKLPVAVGHCVRTRTRSHCITAPLTPPIQDSWEVGTNGAVTVLSKSITPYQFSSEGMIKAANRAQPQHHYRVSRARTSGTGGLGDAHRGVGAPLPC